MKSPRNLVLMAGLGFIMGLFVMWVATCVIKPNNRFNETALKQAVTQTLDAQNAAWNTGNIEAFMQDYWKSPELRFTSNNSIQTGWQGTLERYQRRYPDRGTMGTLQFSDQIVEVLSPTDALVFGRFTLIREGEHPTGLYTLHLKKFGDEWKIVSDHTSTE